MKKFLKNRFFVAGIGALSLVAVWLVWFIAAKTVKNEYLIPTFSQTMAELVNVIKESFFWLALSKTLLKTLCAFAISFALAALFAAAERFFKPLGVFVKPIITIIRTIPTMAILVLILVYTNRTAAPIIVAVMVLFPLLHSQFVAAFNGIDEGVLAATKVFGLTKKQRLFKVYLPLVSPPILGSVGSDLSFGLKLIVSAEIMANTYTSLGGMMQSANVYVEISRLAALTVVAVAVGLVTELIFHLIAKVAFKWKKAGDGND